MTLTLEYAGTLTAGYYNEMEAGYPVFVDDEPLSNVVKEMLRQRGYSGDFCLDDPRRKTGKHHPLVGKRVKLTLEIEDIDNGTT